MEDLASWTESMKALLRAAVTRRAAELKQDPAPLLALIPATTEYQIKRAKRYWSEDEARAYEAEARQLAPGRRALALLPLAAGLRAEEVLTLERSAVKRAAKTGELLVLRKGGEEQILHIPGAVQLLEDLLSAPASLGRDMSGRRPGSWERSGEILSPGKYITRYHVLHRMVRTVGEAAKLDGAHPHVLRHAFATRMMRDGAPLAVISKMLNHKNLLTTQRYVHATTYDATKYLRDFTAPAPDQRITAA